VDDVCAHERRLVQAMIAGLECGPPSLHWYGPRTPAQRTGVFSVRVDSIDDPRRLSELLEREHGVLTRPGLHCAPLAHQTIGTFDRGGTVRLSIGPFVELEDVAHAAEALRRIAERPTDG
jgi:cysteine desulfurase / selenocysteine lyase